MGSGDRRVHGALVQCEVAENSNPEASRASRLNENVRERGMAIFRTTKKGSRERLPWKCRCEFPRR